MAKKMTLWESELRDIAARHRGILQPESVVEYAKSPKTALHGKFTWDDNQAAHQYRLWQARELIAVAVLVLPSTGKSYRAFVSLEDDRVRKGGGYRSLVTVLSNSVLRRKFLEEAIAEFERWQEKYKSLRELSPIFVAEDEVRAEFLSQEKRETVAG